MVDARHVLRSIARLDPLLLTTAMSGYTFGDDIAYVRQSAYVAADSRIQPAHLIHRGGE